MDNSFINIIKDSKKEFKFLAIAFLFTRIVFVISLFVGYYFLPKGWDEYPNVHNPIDLIFQFNDAGAYNYIAKNGYENSNFAFAPLFPISVKLMSFITGSYGLAGLIVSNISFILVLLILYYYLFDFIGKKPSMYAVLGLIVYPASHYNSIGYTEALFLLMAVISLIAYKKEDYLISALFCGLSCLTRITGLALLAGYGLDMLINYIKNKDFSVLSILKLLKHGLSFLAVVLAVYGLWLVYMYAKTGDAFYFLEAQKAWDRKPPNFFVIPYIIKLFIRAFEFPALRTALEFLLPMVMITFSVLSIKKLPIYFWFYSAMTIIMPLTTQSHLSLTRLPMVALAAYAFIGIKSAENKIFRIVWFLASFVFYVIFTGTMGQMRATFI